MTAMMAYNCISRWSGALGVCAIIAVIRPAHADPRAVVELFTSQGCSSCPPADKIVGELAKDPNVIALSMPIDYWDYLGWKDTLADSRFSARQKAYSHVRGDRNLYTPQMIVNGSAQVIGSDRQAVEAACKNAAKNALPVTLTRNGDKIDVEIGAGQGAPATVWLLTVTRSTPVTIGRGENHGRTVTYSNVVRSWQRIADWTGAPIKNSVTLPEHAKDADAIVILVQPGSVENPGPVRGASMLALR